MLVKNSTQLCKTIRCNSTVVLQVSTDKRRLVEHHVFSCALVIPDGSENSHSFKGQRKMRPKAQLANKTLQLWWQ